VKFQSSASELSLRAWFGRLIHKASAQMFAAPTFPQTTRQNTYNHCCKSNTRGHLKPRQTLAAAKPKPILRHGISAVLPYSESSGDLTPPQLSSNKNNSSNSCAPRRVYNTFEWHGHRINYRVEGGKEGEHQQKQHGAVSVLLIHGFGSNIAHWRNNVRELTANGAHRVVAVDLLGFGASDKPDLGEGGYNLALWRDILLDLIQFIDERSASRWVIVGNSIGCLVGMMLALELQQQQQQKQQNHSRRGRLLGVVLFNCAPSMVGFRPEELHPIFSTSWNIFRSIAFSDFVGSFLFNFIRTPLILRLTLMLIYKNRAQVTHELVAALREPAYDKGALNTFLYTLRGAPGPSPRELVAQLRVPVLVMWGMSDPWASFRSGTYAGERFAEWNARVQLEPIDAGHCPMCECSELCNARMLRFLHELLAQQD